MGDLWTFGKKWWPGIVTALVAVGATGVFLRWGYSDVMAYHARPRDEIIRNYGLLVAAFWAAAFAVWRSQIANRQAEIASQQAEIASRQAETSERGLRNERFQKGADMLGNQTFATRMGGIYALERLARDHPEDYLDQIIKLLSTFVRHPVRDKQLEDEDAAPVLRPDVMDALRALGTLNGIDVKHLPPDLHAVGFRGKNLESLNFKSWNFTGADLSYATLTGADLTGATLEGADLTLANLTDADLTGATLEGADLTNADISGANFSGAQGLQQDQIDRVLCHPDYPPQNLPDHLTLDKEAAAERWQQDEQIRMTIGNWE